MRALTLWQPYLAGVLHGDGWCTRLTLGLRVNDGDFARAFCGALKSGFGVDRRPKRDERGYWLVRVGNKRGTFDGLRTYRPRGRKEIAAWLRGLFDSEGNAQLCKAKISANSWHRRVSFYSTDQTTLDRAATYLSELGIETVWYVEKNSKGHKGTKVVYQLRIRPGQHNYRRFALLVGSSIARKRESLHRIYETYQEPGHHARAGRVGSASRRRRRDAGGRY